MACLLFSPEPYVHYINERRYIIRLYITSQSSHLMLERKLSILNTFNSMNACTYEEMFHLQSALAPEHRNIL